MRERAWDYLHSVDCEAPRRFAWNYWTNVANWDDPPAKFHLDGPFEAGSRLTTILLNQTTYSTIREVKTEREALIELDLPNAVLSFRWVFEDIPDQRTRITQQLLLTGSNASSFAAGLSVFKQTIPEGMKKLVAAIERAQRS